MSLHVYIAKEGFKDNPISYDDWLAVARSCNDLNVLEKKNRKGVLFHEIYLKTNKKQRLTLDPYGLVHTQNPNKALIKIMFKLAPQLNSKVYSERLKAYASVEDWEKRTKNYRESRQERINEYRYTWHKRKPFWIIMAIILGTIIGLLKG